MAAIILALLALTTTAFAQDECEDGIKPIYIDFHNRNVSANNQNIQYGLFVGVGSPFQNQSLWPSISHNETTFSGPDLCEDNDNPECLEQTHGTYIPEDSETFVNISQSEFRDQYLLDEIPTEPATVALTGNDTLNLYTHYFDPSPATVTHIDNFPVSQLTTFSSSAAPWFGPSGLLGLGPSAPVLTRLLDANLISTRSFGLYLGTAYPRAGGAINGSLTLGGYDSGRLTGPAHTFDLATDYDILRGETSFRVTIDSITLTTSSSSSNNDTIPLLLNTTTTNPIPAYLTTSQHSITFPPSIIEAFIAATSAETQPNEFSEPSLHLPSSSTALYTLNITLSSGLSVIIPPEEMRNASNASPISAASNTSSTPSNSTDPDADADADAEAGPILLGAAFLQHLYLTTQYPSASSPPSQPARFHLNAAAPHGPYVLPVPLCATSVPEEGDPVPNKLSAWERNGIVGAVLGGIIGGIGLGFAVFWCWGRWRAGRGWAEAEAEAEAEEGEAANGTGKGKGNGYEGVGGDGGGKSLSDGSSNSDDGRDQGDVHGYDMQQFSPVGIPAAYGDYDSTTAAADGHAGAGGAARGPDATPAAAAAATAAVGTAVGNSSPNIPFDFAQGLSSQSQHRGPHEGGTEREPLAPSSYYNNQSHSQPQPHSQSNPSNPSSGLGDGWEKVTIGQAISTPPLLQVQTVQRRSLAAEYHHGDAATLRSISPVSPISPGLFASEEEAAAVGAVGAVGAPGAPGSAGVRGAGGVSASALAADERSWMQSHRQASGFWGFTGEARTGERIKVNKMKIPLRKAVGAGVGKGKGMGR